MDFRGRRPARERALAGLYGLAELGEQVRRQAAQGGMGKADVREALTDGGAGPGEFMGAYSSRAVCVPDFYHAAERFNDPVKALHPDEARAAAEGWCPRQ